MTSKVFSGAIVGIDSEIVEVETDVSYGLRSFNIVGLPDAAVKESKERVGSAIKASGFLPPHKKTQRVLVNLAPADLKKEGSLYDLPIAIGYLSASQQTKFNPQERFFAGELGLDGKVRPIKGVLPLTLKAKEKNFKEIVLPKENAPEACLVSGIRVIGIDSLKEAIDYLENKTRIPCFKINIEKFLNKENYSIDLRWIKGQESSKRALEIAAAGGHNLFFFGPPGAGKSILARALPSILPPLSPEEMLQVSKIYSVAGFLSKEKPFISSRPFRAPHHSISKPALIGGGNPPRPGEITLSHRGVLFLDEFPEFARDVLESLRQPLEEGKIIISRAKYSFVFPCSFTLIAASNPCPCGYYNSPHKTCNCSPSQIANYKKKLSGPLMDRIDMFVEVPAIKYEKLIEPEKNGLSSEIKERVKKARLIQKERFSNNPFLLNSRMQIPEIKKYCQVDLKSQNLLKHFINTGKLSARGYHKVLKVARTIADLEFSKNIKYEHLAEALMYRIREE